jgi:hypothetical protein
MDVQPMMKFSAPKSNFPVDLLIYLSTRPAASGASSETALSVNWKGKAVVKKRINTYLGIDRINIVA